MAEVATGALWKKVFLKISQILRETSCVGVFFDKVAGFCEPFKNTYFEEHLWTTASNKVPHYNKET